MRRARTQGSSSQESSQVRSQFQRSVEEGEERLERTWPNLLATGMVGGIDMGIGVFALLLVLHETGNPLLGGLAFSIGFIALTLGQSELFTENYLVPIMAVAAGRAGVSSIGRLWFGTALTNFVGGWIITWIILSSAPQLAPTAVETAKHYIDLGIGWHSFALAILGGTVITLMTWMERGSHEVLSKVVAAIVAGFLLAAGELNHVIVVSLEIFAAFHAGAPFGYADWLSTATWAALGNTLGGIAFVTVLRLVQVGRRGVQDGRRHPAVESEQRQDISARH
jgi:formate-nitrite transporter family protein